MIQIRTRKPMRTRDRINEAIRVKDVRLIDENGEQVGIVDTGKALAMAQEVGLDLVEVAPKAVPPVCRIIDYGKYTYQQSKRAHEAKKKQKLVHRKEIKIRPNIEDHDYQVKLKHAREFLEDGNKLKLTMQFRGREFRLQEKAKIVIDRFIEDLDDIGIIETAAKMEGRQMFLTLSARTPNRKGQDSHAKDENK